MTALRLTWIEYPQHGRPPVQRTGMVWAPAPEDGAVWVVPDEPRRGEGPVVVVHGVTGDTGRGVRHVGGRGDYRSTDRWQTWQALPPALLRTDRITTPAGVRRVCTLLHARRRCLVSGAGPVDRVRRGRYQEAERCYVFDGWLHEVSRPPTDLTGAPVRVCGACLKAGPPR